MFVLGSRRRSVSSEARTDLFDGWRELERVEFRGPFGERGGSFTTDEEGESRGVVDGSRDVDLGRGRGEEERSGR